MEKKQIIIAIAILMLVAAVFFFIIPQSGSKKQSILRISDSININGLNITVVDIEGRNSTSKQNQTILVYLVLGNPSEMRMDLQSYNLSSSVYLLDSTGTIYAPINYSSTVKNNLTYENLKDVKRLREKSRVGGFFAFETSRVLPAPRLKVSFGDETYIFLLNYSKTYDSIYDYGLHNSSKDTMFVDFLDQKGLNSRLFILKSDDLKLDKDTKSIAHIDGIFTETLYAYEADKLITSAERKNGSFRLNAVNQYKKDLVDLMNKLIRNQSLSPLHFSICDEITCVTAECNGSTFNFNGYCNKSSGACIYETYSCPGGCAENKSNCIKPLTLGDKVIGRIPAALETWTIYVKFNDVYNSECNGFPTTCFSFIIETPMSDSFTIPYNQYFRDKYIVVAHDCNGSRMNKFDECSAASITAIPNKPQEYTFCFERMNPRSVYIAFSNYPQSYLSGWGAAAEWTFYILNETDNDLIYNPSKFIK